MKWSGSNFQAAMKRSFGFFSFSFLHPCCKIMGLTDPEAKKEQDILEKQQDIYRNGCVAGVNLDAASNLLSP